MTTALQNQFASSPPGCAVAAIKTAAGCVSNIRPQFSLGCPEASQDLAEPEAMLLVAQLYFLARRLAIMQKH